MDRLPPALLPLAASLLAGCTPDPTELGTWSLAEAEAWTRIPLELDPLDPPAEARCEDRGVVLEEGVIEVLTELCGWATLSQPSRVDIEPGDSVELFAYHGPLSAVEPAEGVMTLSVEGQELWGITVPIPSSDGVYIEAWAADQAWPAGSELLLHVHNHGANAWRLAGLTRTRE